MKKLFLRRMTGLFVFTALLAAMTAVPAGAADYQTAYGTPLQLHSSDFLPAYTDSISGIYVSRVPDAADGTFTCAGRVLRAGDVLSAASLDQLQTQAERDRDGSLTLSYYPIVGGKLSQSAELTVTVSESKNDPPTAHDSTFETYKNVPNDGTLQVEDPENETLTYTLTKEPKRGTVELSEDGSFTYTPNENKVGKDKFSFTATDPAGNVSNEATVSIKILKPEDAATYSDMQGDLAQFEALWLRNSGLLGGKTVAGNACFEPEQTVSRGEFLVMVMDLAQIKPDSTALCSGFRDEDDAPTWVHPYLASAMRSGIVSGVRSDEGLMFEADRPVTYAQAAVMVQNLLGLNRPEQEAAVSDNTSLPVWASDSVQTLAANGIVLETADFGGDLTRRDCAQLLYQLSRNLA